MTTISATIEQHQDQTRTSLFQGEVLWTAEDKIFITQASDPDNAWAVYTLAEGAGTTQGAFKGAEMPQGQKWAFYPNTLCNYNSDHDFTFGSVKLPKAQRCLKGSFGNGANPMVAKSNDAGDELTFKNLCGALKLQLTGE